MIEESAKYIEGHAIVYEKPAVLFERNGKAYLEVIDRYALDEADLSNVVMNYNHSNQVMIVARTTNGTLQLISDSIGLKIRAELANTSISRDLYELIKGKFIDKMSFQFNNWKSTYDEVTNTRRITKIGKIIDVSCVDFPAYPQTTLGAIEELGLRKEFIKKWDEYKQSIQLKIDLNQRKRYMTDMLIIENQYIQKQEKQKEERENFEIEKRKTFLKYKY